MHFFRRRGLLSKSVGLVLWPKNLVVGWDGMGRDGLGPGSGKHSHAASACITRREETPLVQVDFRHVHTKPPVWLNKPLACRGSTSSQRHFVP